MLVLSRKESESIVIGDGIVVIVNRIFGNRVRLGIEAPSEIRVLRGELIQKNLFFMDNDNSASTSSLPQNT